MRHDGQKLVHARPRDRPAGPALREPLDAPSAGSCIRSPRDAHTPRRWCRPRSSPRPDKPRRGARPSRLGELGAQPLPGRNIRKTKSPALPASEHAWSPSSMSARRVVPSRAATTSSARERVGNLYGRLHMGIHTTVYGRVQPGPEDCPARATANITPGRAPARRAQDAPSSRLSSSPCPSGSRITVLRAATSCRWRTAGPASGRDLRKTPGTSPGPAPVDGGIAVHELPVGPPEGAPTR